MLHKGVDILVATPGRLLDLMNQGYIHLDNATLHYWMRADRMLDMDLSMTSKRLLPKLPKEKQTLFFSATIPDTITLTNSLLETTGEDYYNPKIIYGRYHRTDYLFCGEEREVNC